MPEDDLRTDHRPGSGAEPHQDFLAAENVSLRLLLEQAEINSRSLLAKAGIDAREREASDKLQKLILEELHHRIKNTLATIGAIVSQSLRNLPGAEHAQRAITTAAACRRDRLIPLRKRGRFHPRRSEALKKAGLLRRTADNQGVNFAKRGRPRKR